MSTWEKSLGRERYIIRLDDAAERMDVAKWNRMEKLLDKYRIRPLVGVIPDIKDPMMDKYETDKYFWNKVHAWQKKGWDIAMHGYQHIYDSNNGGINPVNNVSEFAGHPLEVQKDKIREAVKIFRNNGIEPEMFFAPSHTFDRYTMEALKTETKIRIISDTPAWNAYLRDGFIFIPAQAGEVRKLPFRICTFCYHPNTMEESEWIRLQKFLVRKAYLFTNVSKAVADCNKSGSLIDRATSKAYFFMRKLKRRI